MQSSRRLTAMKPNPREPMRPRFEMMNNLTYTPATTMPTNAAPKLGVEGEHEVRMRCHSARSWPRTYCPALRHASRKPGRASRGKGARMMRGRQQRFEQQAPLLKCRRFGKPSGRGKSINELFLPLSWSRSLEEREGRKINCSSTPFCRQVD